MNPDPFSFLLFSSLLLSVASTDTKLPMNCFPASCGSVTNITFPFWLNGTQPNYCGFPDFELICQNNTTLVLVMSSEAYHVKEIFYKNQSLVLSNPNIINEGCPVPHFNLSFSLSPFTISPINKQLIFFHGCPFNPNYYQVPCGSNGTFAYLGGGYENSQLFSLGNGCQTAVAPVLGYPGADGSDYLRLLENGFLAEWVVSNCTECKGSGGQCGYNHEAENFMCICPDRVHWRSCQEADGKNSSVRIVIGCTVGATAFIAIFCFGVFLYCRRRTQQRSVSSDLLFQSNSSKLSFKKDPEIGDANYQTPIFTYDELQEATNGFDASTELGDGGFGTVYKGKLRDGRTVAVKRLYDHNYRRLEQFMNEVQILSLIRHPNLVTLYGATSRHSRELLLVYEFVSNGTVADHLHGDRATEGVLTWPLRLSIAIETASALAYLHATEPQIIHRDVKTNNILLDNNFHVKVADFGLSRLFPLDATHVSTAPQGTPGYVDPEYHQCYQLTDKSDVYSFGVVLVELISSKPAVDISRHRHEINLANLALNKIQNCELDQLVDPGLGYQSDPEMKRKITLVAELAFRCLQSDGDMRPCIKEVLENLGGIESGVYNSEKVGEATECPPKEESRLLKIMPYSPDSVTDRWTSRLTTPNTSE